MANDQKASVVPTFTGMSVPVESAIRNILNHAAGVLTGMILLWLSTHGFNEHAANALGFSLSEVVGALVASVLTGVATIVWGWWQAHRGEFALVNSTIQAALTGNVPVAIAKKATMEQAVAIEQSPTTNIVNTPPKVN